MKNLLITTILLLLIQCVEYKGFIHIEKASDLKKIEKVSPLVYAKIKVNALRPKIDRYDYGGTMNLFQFHAWYVKEETNFYDVCVLFDSNKNYELVVGHYGQEIGRAWLMPKILKKWKFEIPQDTSKYYYLGTITQDNEKSIIVEDSKLDQDECDKYVATIFTNFHPKNSVVLKAKKYSAKD